MKRMANSTPEEPEEGKHDPAQIIAFLKNEMPEPERTAFETRLTESETLRQEVEQTRAMLDSLVGSNDASAIRQVNRMIQEAIERGASDIHLIPQRKAFVVQYRIDGALSKAMELPKHIQRATIDRWKEIADMHLDERRLPQDGRIPVKHEGKDYDLRVSVLPTLYGERVTVRILYQSEVLLGLDCLGYSPAHLDILRRLCRLRSGLILTNGWAGVGKSTLLISLLKELTSPEMPRRNILTIENPIEYQISHTSQTAVDSRIGLTFAAGMQSALRSDPDVIYCGEMRDAETAELCVEAALRGTLVLSSLHTSSALQGIERLRNLGVPDYLIADTVTGLIGMRLVRRIDTRQVEEYQPADEELEKLGMTRADGPFLRGVPTEANGMTGFAGRIPLIEIVEVTPHLRRLIASGKPVEHLWQESLGADGSSLRAHARERIWSGLTTIEEANWVLFDYTTFASEASPLRKERLLRREKPLVDVLLAQQVITSEQHSTLVEIHRRTPDTDMAQLVLQNQYATEVDVYKAKANLDGLPFIDLKKHKPEPSAIIVVPAQVANKYKALPVRKDGRTLYVAMVNPRDIVAADAIRLASRCAVIRPMTSVPTDIEAGLKMAYPEIEQEVRENSEK